MNNEKFNELNKYFQENDNDHLISTQEELDAATHLI